MQLQEHGRSPVGVITSATRPAVGRHKPVIQWGEFGRLTVHLLRRVPDLGAIWFGGRLDPAFREELMVSVAGVNSCRQCSFAHREWALAEGLPEADLAALEGLEPEHFDARTWAAIAWAQAAAGSDFADVPELVGANFRQQFSPQEQADIELVAKTMAWMNRASNTVDAGLSRLRRRPVPESGVLRELVALLAYGLVTPVILIVLAVKQRRGPLSLVREVGPFFHEFEARGPHTISGPGREIGHYPF